MARLLSFGVLLFTTFLSLCLAASSTKSAVASAATPGALAIYPGDGAYKYYGCYNETTLSSGSSGARALAGGQMESLDTMTPIMCLAYCGQSAFAGLQYGRECWCATYLNSLAAHLADSECDVPCLGNTSSACGGNLKITVYSKGASSSSSKSSASTWKHAFRNAGALGGVGMVLAILM